VFPSIVQTISARLDGGLERMSVANWIVRRAVDKACADLVDVGQESSGTPEGISQ
jgi:hypothetical protein